MSLNMPMSQVSIPGSTKTRSIQFASLSSTPTPATKICTIILALPLLKSCLPSISSILYVLPYRAGGKLKFPLCAACVKEQQQKPWLQRTNLCSQTDDERKLRGTWATVELVKAVELGYRILKIHEVFHFLEEQRKVVLFEDYVNSWLKIKQESAGWPDGCKKKNKPTLLIMPKMKGFNWSMWQKTRAGNSWQKWCSTGECLV